ncbi:hypothetical protein C0995_008883 [Termitomyces sp. Mi166|nr:hypothetical protein C0995_008883 [Termitomyces sp. Mi166\
MVRQARDTHDACLDLAYRVQEASLSAQIQESKNPAKIIAKAEEAAIARMERKVKLKRAIQKYQELFGPGSNSQKSFKWIHDTTGEAGHADAPVSQGDI